MIDAKKSTGTDFTREAKDCRSQGNERLPLSNPPSGKVQGCFACGRGFMDGLGDGRFCSTNCRDYFDAGAAPYQEPKTQYDFTMGSEGFIINCEGCGKRFDSKGL